MEILALYTSPEALATALAAGARHLAGILEGLALVYPSDLQAAEPDGWAGFTCARDAEKAGEQLTTFLKQVRASDQPLRTEAPKTPSRIWARAAGGLYGFPLKQTGEVRGVAIIGCPGSWPRMRNAEIESVLKQLTLVLDHHAVSEEGGSHDDSSADDLLDLSEQLLQKDVERMDQEKRIRRREDGQNDLIQRITSELRQPLNRIVEGIISALASEHENLSESGRTSLRGTLDQGNRMMRVLQNISDLWSLKENLIRVEVQDVNVAEVIEEAVFNVRDSLRPGVILEKRLISPLPKVRTDLGKLNQILFHLLDNAAKFTHSGRIELHVAVEEGELRCSVTDSGIGISADDHARIFEPFFQVDTSTDSGYSGAGLGLTLTQGLVEKLGGAIEFSSEVGRGSRFAFGLPVSVV